MCVFFIILNLNLEYSDENSNLPSLFFHVFGICIVISLKNNYVVVVRVNDEFPRSVLQWMVHLVKDGSQFFEG